MTAEHALKIVELITAELSPQISELSQKMLLTKLRALDLGTPEPQVALQNESWPECFEFYDLMQAYRHAPIAKPVQVKEAYEAVKSWLRWHRAEPSAPAAAPLCNEKFMDGPVEKLCAYPKGHSGQHSPYMLVPTAAAPDIPLGIDRTDEWEARHDAAEQKEHAPKYTQHSPTCSYWTSNVCNSGCAGHFQGRE